MPSDRPQSHLSGEFPTFESLILPYLCCSPPSRRATASTRLDRQHKDATEPKEVCDCVQQTFEVDYTPNATTKLMKRLDFVYKKPNCVPAKADAAVQEQFAKETLLPLMAQANEDKPLYFIDGIHPSYTAHPGFGWIRRGDHARSEKTTTAESTSTSMAH
jgi:hypothetical protein